ncbi:MAG: hypothetical protein U1E65_08775 [Myxococcota bacterium]
MRGPLILGLALANAACSLDLPPEYKVDDLRVLDIQVDPPEVPVFQPIIATGTVSLSFDPMHPPPVFRQPVRVRAFVAHPDLGATFSYDWIRCRPGLDRVPCDPADASSLVPERTSEISFTPIDTLFAELAVDPANIAQVAGALAEDPRDLLNGLYAYVNLQANVEQAAIAADTARIQATKRVVLFDPRLVALALEQAQRIDPSQIPAGAGLPNLCAGVSDTQLKTLMDFLASREPNRAPRIRGVHVEVNHVDGSVTTTITPGQGEALTVDETDVVTLEGVPTSSSTEHYGLIDANCLLQSFDERLAFSWFINGGSLAHQITTPEDTTTDLNLPPARSLSSSGGRLRVWVVLRDGRGGSAHGFFDLNVKGAP